jgi:formylglycine-generating enzyme
MNSKLTTILLALVLPIAGQTASAQIPTAGLLGHWHLDGNADDSSGNNRHGTITGAAATTGKFGGAFTFDGNAGIDVGNLDFSSGEYTVSGWVRTTAPAVAETWRSWISKFDEPELDATFELFIGDGRPNSGNGPGLLVWDASLGVVNAYSSELNARDGTWHMITATYSRGNQKLYFDGNLVANNQYSGTLPITGTNVIIGGGDFGQYHHEWMGDIDEVSIYNRAVSDAEVLQLFGGPIIPVAELINNGSFEDNTVGWNSTGKVGIYSLSPYQPSDGTRLVAFNSGNTPPDGTISQSFPTTAGHPYRLEFDVGVLAYNTSKQVLEVTVTGSNPPLTDTISLTGLGNGKTLWLRKSYAFTANSAVTTLTFQDRSTSTIAIDLLLDRVRVFRPILRTLDVSTEPGGLFESAPVIVSPTDVNRDGDGDFFRGQGFRRSYFDGAEVNLTAPANLRIYGPGTALKFNFQKWTKNGFDFATTAATRVVMNADHRMTAIYTYSPPEIFKQPVSVVVGLGESATFQVIMQPQHWTEVFLYRWRFNGIEIPGAVGNTYTIPNVFASDAGNYDVVITSDDLSTVSDQVKLTILSCSLANGSFESDYQSWTGGGNQGLRATAPYVASKGLKLIAFNAGNTAANGWVSQTFATTPGTTYLVSFDMGVIAYNTNEQRMQVDIGGSLPLASQMFSLTGIGGGRTRWETKTIPFIANSAATILTFRDRSTTSLSVDLLLDNIQCAAIPSDFAIIPAGSFQMGDTFGEGEPRELPVHQVSVGTFFLAKHEVSKALWDGVRAWGTSNGYPDLPLGTAKAANHPVESINWYDMVKWCNARSEREGMTPCYTVSGTVYRTGGHAPECNWSANGYRLPTEAEWEKAARGGLSGKRFPWGDTISHSQANYHSSSAYGYDISPTRNFHPIYNDGTAPYTAPVGSFAANAYGLHDMAGNLWESCWDRWSASYYASSPTSDPRGPSTGTDRIIKGGGAWDFPPIGCRVAFRNNGNPNNSFYGVGFRLARSRVP